MSNFFLLLVAGLVTQAGAVDTTHQAPLCSPEHRAWFASVDSRLTVQWYDNECANIREVSTHEAPHFCWRWNPGDEWCVQDRVESARERMRRLIEREHPESALQRRVVDPGRMRQAERDHDERSARARTSQMRSGNRNELYTGTGYLDHRARRLQWS
jgi:hypothetical protein